MTGRLDTLFFLACAAASSACGRDPGVGPDHDGSGTERTPVLAVLELSPATFVMVPGATLQLVAVARDQRGVPMSPSGTITYASDAPTIATVSSTGFVTGVAPGSAVISATVSVGGSTRQANMTTHVLEPDAPGQLLLTAGAEGWEPSVAQVIAGGIVRWSTGPTNWTGMPNTKLYLMDARYSVVDSLDLSSGSATRSFDTPGTIRYCSGGCWDPPDFGVIHVR